MTRGAKAQLEDKGVLTQHMVAPWRDVGDDEQADGIGTDLVCCTFIISIDS